MSDPAGDGLAACLSRLLVAWTIELDNEFEQHMPHRTALFGPGGPEPVLPSSGRPFRAPWLTSVAMWQNGLRYVLAEGVPRASLDGLGANLAGLERWGYLRSEESVGDPAVRPTAAGRYAQAVWMRLEGTVERRWQDRFGADLIAQLRVALTAVAGQNAQPAPLYLPVVTYLAGMRTGYRSPAAEQLNAAGVPDQAAASMDTLLSRALLAFTVDYEAESRLSLPMTADVLAALTDRAIPLRHVPLLGGVSKEAVQSAIGFLERRGLAVAGTDPAAARGKAVSLTGRGRVARDRYGRRWRAVEQAWEDRIGRGVVTGLRAVLGDFAGHGTGGAPTIALGLRPYENGWRARSRYRAQSRAVLASPWTALPRHPMILHRGGFPDGS
ncbi:MAG: hypothetical protein ACR2FU_00665 [Streptosporangiaceae bacterium]